MELGKQIIIEKTNQHVFSKVFYKTFLFVYKHNSQNNNLRF